MPRARRTLFQEEFPSMKPRHYQPNVAVIAAELLTTIRQIGSRMGLDPDIDEETRNVQLVLDSPFCRKPIYYRPD